MSLDVVDMPVNETEQVPSVMGRQNKKAISKVNAPFIESGCCEKINQGRGMGCVCRVWGESSFKYRMTEEGPLNHTDRSGGDLKEENLPGISLGENVLAQGEPPA